MLWFLYTNIWTLFRPCSRQNPQLGPSRSILRLSRSPDTQSPCRSVDLLSDRICLTKRALDWNVVIQMSLGRSFVPQPTQHFSKEMRFWFVRSPRFCCSFRAIGSTLWCPAPNVVYLSACPASSCTARHCLM